MSTTTTIELETRTAVFERLPNADVGPGETLIPSSHSPISTKRAVVVIGTVTGVTFLNTTGSGILTVALPTIASDLLLPRELLLWPASVYALTCGCTLLLAGSMADIVGRRICFLVGCALYSAFTLGCGLANSSAALITFRAFQGVAISLCLTTAVGIITNTFPASQRRNIAFACLGAGSPVGYSLGLVLGGVFVETIGWRYAFYLAAIANVLVLLAAFWGLPTDVTMQGKKWARLGREIDWVGAGLATVSISILSYVLAVVAGSSSSMHEVVNIVLLTLGLALLPAFVFWVGRQERLGRPAIIPNSIWKQPAFSCTCIAVFLTWGAFNPFGYFSTLFFQEVQSLSALQTSLRFLPNVVCGVLTNVATGLLVKNTSAVYLVAVSSVFSAAAPLIMALINPNWTFWAAAFPAVFLSPMSCDVLYTISNLIIADAFPASKQSLAGGVFNTVSQIGNSVGLAVAAVIAATVTATQDLPQDQAEFQDQGQDEKDALMYGFRATFWALAAAILLVVPIAAVGLRRAGKVGRGKSD